MGGRPGCHTNRGEGPEGRRLQGAPERRSGPAGHGGRDAVGALAEALKDTNSQIRQIAATALKNIGPEAREAIPALTLALKDPVPEVRDAAARALKKIDRKGKSKPRK